MASGVIVPRRGAALRTNTLPLSPATAAQPTTYWPCGQLELTLYRLAMSMSGMRTWLDLLHHPLG